MAYCTVNGAKLYYEVHGKGEPLLIVPGGAADGRFYEGMSSILKDYFQVIVVDPRGSGRSETNSTNYSFDLFANDLTALLKYLDIKSTHVFGHSMGGMVAQHLSYRNPEYVKKLVLFATDNKMSAFGNHCCKAAAVIKSEGSLKSFIYLIAIWNFTEQFLANEDNIKNMLKGAEQDPYPLSAKSLMEQMKIIEHFDSASRLKDIKAPTLVIGGEKDLIFPAKDVKAFAAKIPGAQFKEIPNATHSFHIEYPQVVANMVLNFLES